jgi:hypothetical protein
MPGEAWHHGRHGAAALATSEDVAAALDAVAGRLGSAPGAAAREAEGVVESLYLQLPFRSWPGGRFRHSPPHVPFGVSGANPCLPANLEFSRPLSNRPNGEVYVTQTLPLDRHLSVCGSAGSCTVTRSPPAGRGVRVRVPSCAWVMLLTIARPRPTPAWSVRIRSVPR